MISKCINLQTISAFLAGSLDEKAVSDIEAHLADCDRCREQIVLSKEILLDPDLTTEPLLSEKDALIAIEQLSFSKTAIQKCKEKFQSIKINIQQQWQTFTDQRTQAMPTHMAFAPVYVRSSEENNALSRQITIPFQDYRIDCTIVAETKEDHCQLFMKIFLQKQLAQNCRITLVDSNHRTVSRLTETGELHFENIPFGECQLALLKNGSPVGETTFYTGNCE